MGCDNLHGNRRQESPGTARAAVALLLRPRGSGRELLLIRRAERSGDPWSGHVALPGGRLQAEDGGDLAAAIRETREEVGIELGTAGRLLGSLEPVRPLGALTRIDVAPFVFAVAPGTEARPNVEVAAAFWVNLDRLADPSARAEYVHPPVGDRFPALLAGEHTIWGLTYRVLVQLLSRLGHDPAGFRLAHPMPYESVTLQLTARQAEALRALAEREQLPPETYAAEVLVKHLYHAFSPDLAAPPPPAGPGEAGR